MKFLNNLFKASRKKKASQEDIASEIEETVLRHKIIIDELSGLFSRLLHEIRPPIYELENTLQNLRDKSVFHYDKATQKEIQKIEYSYIKMEAILDSSMAAYKLTNSSGFPDIGVYDDSEDASIHNILDVVETLKFIFLKITKELMIKVISTEVGSFHIKAPKKALLICLSNIHNNSIEAFDFMNSRDRSYEKQITISTHLRQKHLFIEISDNGAGISPDVEPDIFKDGFSTKSSNRGHGLSQAKEIAKTFQGDITIKSLSNPTIVALIIPLERI